MKKTAIFTVMLVSVLALAYSQAALSGTYRFSTNAYITFTGNAFSGLWNAKTPMSGTYSVSGSRLSLTITSGPKAKNTWVWTITDANTLKDQDGDTWKKEGAGGTVQTRSSAPVEWNVNNAATWIEAVGGVRSGGNNKAHIITVSGDISVPMSRWSEYTFGSVTGITVTIQGNGSITPSSSGNLIVIGADQTVVLKGDITLKGRDDGETSVVRIWKKSTFRMEGNSTVTGNRGRGVYVGDGATFTMNGGTISRITGTGLLEGDGVQVEGTFTMNDGTISGNTSRGVYVSGGATFTMKGGTISGNMAGVSSEGNGTFTMSGGIISGNSGCGVGVGGFTMSGGAISGNSGGGVSLISYGSSFTMNGGTISGNTVSGKGGGLYVGNGRFTMKGGTISGNTANGNGGGVYVEGGGFSKTGGTISGNDAAEADRNTAKQGHAVYNDNGTWRNATAGPKMTPETYGFWLND